MTGRLIETVRSRRRRRAGAAVALAVLCAGSALLAGGCGSSTVGGIVDPVASAASLSNSQPGYRMTFSLRMSSSALPTPITATGTGSFDGRAHQGTVTTLMNFGSSSAIKSALGSNSLSLVELLKGLTIYIKFPPALADKLPGVNRPWVKIDVAKVASAAGIPGLSSIASPTSSNPAQMLQYLRAVTGGVTKVGTARVGNFPTTQYHGTISLDRYPDTLPPASRAAARQTVKRLEQLTSLRDLPVDVWLDAHKLVRRIRVSFDEKLPSGQSMHSLYDITIPEYGPQTPPTFPPADQVFDFDSLIHSHA